MDWNLMSPKEKAQDLLRQASEAAHRGSHVEANSLYLQAGQLAQGVGDARTEVRALLGQAGLVGWIPGEFGFERRGVLAQRALEIAREFGDRAGQAGALRWLSSVAPHKKGEELLRESLSISEELGDKAGVAHALTRLSNHCGLSGRSESGREYGERAVAIYRELDDRPGLASALFCLMLRYDLGDPRREACLLEALKLNREMGNEGAVVRTLDMLGRLVYDDADPRCEPYLLEGLEIRRRGGDPQSISHSLQLLALHHEAKGDTAKAKALRSEADSIYKEPALDEEMQEELEAALGSGDPDRARDALLEAVDYSLRRRDEP